MSDSTDPNTSSSEPSSSQPNSSGPAPSTVPPPIPGPRAAPVLTEKEINDGKAFAILSYAINFLGIPFWLVPLIMRNNDFALYHAKQCLILWLAGMIGYVVGGILTTICIGVFVLVGVLIAMLVFNIIGLIAAINGQCKPLPLIGKFADEWFAGITRVPQ